MDKEQFRQRYKEVEENHPEPNFYKLDKKLDLIAFQVIENTSDIDKHEICLNGKEGKNGLNGDVRGLKMAVRLIVGIVAFVGTCAGIAKVFGWI